MGVVLSRLRGSRVGSSSFYEQYDRNFERHKAYIIKIKAQQLKGQRQRSRLSSLILWYAGAIFVAFFAFAAWVTRQLPGTYSVRGHFLRVAPVFAWPPAAWAVHACIMYLASWKARRDAARLKRAQDRMRQMLTDLKDSTHYDKTLELLRKYDPEFAAAEAKQRARLRAQSHSPSPAGQPATPPGVPQQAATSPRQLGGLVGSGIRGAGSRMFPALDYLATSLIGDNPALTGALREARSEGEALRLRLARAEAQVVELQTANAALRVRLGEPDLGPEPSTPGGEAQASAPATPTSISAAVRSQELLEAAAAKSPAHLGLDAEQPSAEGQPQQAADVQREGASDQQQPHADGTQEQHPAGERSPLSPELSLAASLSAAGLADWGRREEGEPEVSSDAAGDGAGIGGRHDEAFEFRRRPSAAADDQT